MSPSSSSCSMTVEGVSSLPAASTRSGSASTTSSDVDLRRDHDVGDVGDLGRVVVEVGHADQAVAGIEGADDLRVRRRQADDPHRLGVDRHGAAGVIGQLDGNAAAGVGLGVAGGSVADGLAPAGAQAARTSRRRMNEEMAGLSHVMSVPFTRGWRHRDSAGRPGSRAPAGATDTVAGLRRHLTGFAIYPSVLRRTAPTASSLIGAPMLAGPGSAAAPGFRCIDRCSTNRLNVPVSLPPAGRGRSRAASRGRWTASRAP